MAGTVTVNDLLNGHVALDVECMDRIYLNGYVPNLRVGGQVVSFMTSHLGLSIPSPAILEKIGTRFRRAVHQFARDQQIPMIRFGKADRKIEVMRRYLDAAARVGPVPGGRGRVRPGVSERVRRHPTARLQRCPVVLLHRGVKDVLIVCCDGLTGFPEAVEATWPRATVQTCGVHLIRASMRFVSYTDRKTSPRCSSRSTPPPTRTRHWRR